MLSLGRLVSAVCVTAIGLTSPISWRVPMADATSPGTSVSQAQPSLIGTSGQVEVETDTSAGSPPKAQVEAKQRRVSERSSISRTTPSLAHPSPVSDWRGAATARSAVAARLGVSVAGSRLARGDTPTSSACTQGTPISMRARVVNGWNRQFFYVKGIVTFAGSAPPSGQWFIFALGQFPDGSREVRGTAVSTDPPLSWEWVQGDSFNSPPDGQGTVVGYEITTVPSPSTTGYTDPATCRFWFGRQLSGVPAEYATPWGENRSLTQPTLSQDDLYGSTNALTDYTSCFDGDPVETATGNLTENVVDLSASDSSAGGFPFASPGHTTVWARPTAAACCATVTLRMTASFVMVTWLGHESAPPALAGGAWWSRCRGGRHSVVTSVTAARVADSSTMALPVA